MNKKNCLVFFIIGIIIIIVTLFFLHFKEDLFPHFVYYFSLFFGCCFILPENLFAVTEKTNTTASDWKILITNFIGMIITLTGGIVCFIKDV